MKALNRFHLNGLRALEAVGRLGSLQAAARELGVSLGAVSQQVIKAERQLGHRLFDRTARGLAPTELGRAMLPVLGAGFRELERAVRLAAEQDDTTLIVSVAPVFASKWLVPRLAGFSRSNPDLRIRLDASVELVDLDRSDVDLAIRVGDGNWPGVERTFLVAQEVFPVCAPEIAANLRSPRDIVSVPILRDVNSTLRWNLWLDQFGIAESELTEGHGFTDASLCLDAAIAGQGMMLAWPTLAHDALAAGRLVAPFAERSPTGIGYWLLATAARARSGKVRRFREWIIAELARLDVGGGTPVRRE